MYSSGAVDGVGSLSERLHRRVVSAYCWYPWAFSSQRTVFLDLFCSSVGENLFGPGSLQMFLFAFAARFPNLNFICRAHSRLHWIPWLKRL